MLVEVVFSFNCIHFSCIGVSGDPCYSGIPYVTYSKVGLLIPKQYPCNHLRKKKNNESIIIRKEIVPIVTNKAPYGSEEYNLQFSGNSMKKYKKMDYGETKQQIETLMNKTLFCMLIFTIIVHCNSRHNTGVLVNVFKSLNLKVIKLAFSSLSLAANITEWLNGSHSLSSSLAPGHRSAVHL